MTDSNPRKATGGMPQVGVRLPPPTIEEIDALVEERNAAAGWAEVNRSDVIRELVQSGLEQVRRREPTVSARKPKK
jgi:Arc/MetJ-type ribon-helix-helix transcriptional regulator